MYVRRTSLLALVIVAVAPGTAFSQGVGTGSPTDTTLNLEHLVGIPEDPPGLGVTIGRGDPIPVSLDPQGPAWSVHLLPLSPGVAPDGRVVFDEYLTVDGQHAWTGWQIDLMTPELRWFYFDPHLYGNVDFFAGS